MRRAFYAALVSLGLCCLGAFPSFADDWEVWVPDGEETGLSSGISLTSLLADEVGQDEEIEDEYIEDDEADEDVELVNDLATASDATRSDAVRSVSSSDSDEAGDDAGIVLLSAYSPYDYGLSSSVLAYFDDYVGRLGAEHYVLFRSDQYGYRLVYGSDLSLTGSEFAGTDCSYVTYDSHDYTWQSGSEGDFSLSAGDYLVYSDLGDYPVLAAESVPARLIAFVAVLYLLFVVFRSWFSPQRMEW